MQFSGIFTDFSQEPKNLLVTPKSKTPKWTIEITAGPAKGGTGSTKVPGPGTLGVRDHSEY